MIGKFQGTNAATTRTTIDNAGATLFSGITGNTDTRNTQGIVTKSPYGLSFNAYGGNGSRNWRIRPDDLGGWADLDFSCAPTDTATDWPDASSDLVLSLQGDTKDVVVSNGNLKIGTSGKGINFSAYADGTGNPISNLLDDYEEGTFTPVWEGVTTAGTVSYGQNMARYTKIGNVVHCNGYTQINSATGSAGNWLMSNLPFNNNGLSTASPYETGSCMMNNFDFPSAMDDASAWVVTYKPASNTYMYLYYSIDNGQWAPLQAGHDTVWDIIWSLSYKV